MKISILGTGAYGMALASIFDYNKYNVKMWTNSKDEMDLLLMNRKSNKIDYDIPNNFVISTDMKSVVEDTDIIVIVVPAKFVDNVSKELKKYYKNKQVICIASKGIEQETCLFMYDIVKNNIDTNEIVVLSGGTFANDIVKKVPVGLSIATRSDYANDLIIKSMQNEYVKLRITEDIIGTEICGSIKNLFAIAAGILDGMGYPESTSAMFITEALHDIKKLIKVLGGDCNTILSFAGVGDLILTCTSTKSRNYTLGKIIGENKPREEIDKYVENNTIEGLYTLETVMLLLKNKSIEIPIINVIYDIVMNKKDPIIMSKFLVEKE